MGPIDIETKKSRGYFMLSRLPRLTSSSVHQLVKLKEKGSEFLHLSNQLSENPPKNLLDLIVLLKYIFLESSASLGGDLAPDVQTLLSFSECGIDLTGPGLDEEFSKELSALKSSIIKLPLYQICIQPHLLYGEKAMLFTVFLLAIPEQMLEQTNADVLEEFYSLRNSSLPLPEKLDEQILRLGDQLATLHHYCHCQTKNRHIIVSEEN